MAKAKYDLRQLLRTVVEKKASDLHIAAGAVPKIRVDGDLIPAGEEVLSAADAKVLCYESLTPEQTQSFESGREIDLAIEEESLKTRFRVNLCFQRGTVAGAFRPIPVLIPKAADLGLPQQAMALTEKPRGLVLVTGPTGSGKSTSLAAMIDQINATRREHIITVEDPIEFLHSSKQSVVVQREVEKDTESFPAALKRILRQDPDVVLIGEMRDLETIQAALTISETGHLVFATLHTNTAAETINRVIDVFPAHQQAQVRTQLSFILQGILCQQLVPKKSGGRALVMEMLFPTPAIRNLIREAKVHQIYAVMQMDQARTGMVTMNQSLVALVKKDVITTEEALGFSTDIDELKKLLGS